MRLPSEGAASSCNLIATQPTQETFPLGIGGIIGLVLLAGVIFVLLSSWHDGNGYVLAGGDGFQVD